jgi:hypothetical protein
MQADRIRAIRGSSREDTGQGPVLIISWMNAENLALRFV